MADFLTNIYVIQGIGFLAFILAIIAFSLKNDVALKKMIAAQCSVLTVHFVLLGAYSGAGSIFLAGVRTYLSIYKQLKFLAPVFIGLYVVIGYYFYETWVDLLPVIGSMIATFGLFYLEKIPMRLCYLVTTTLWLIHNALVHSIGPFFMEAFIFLANARTIYGLIKEQKA